ncbi:hypothetical protein ABZX40_25065 [Streptomyces sp. NPDC004610]|uniref:hypothetical protein n=1 Tax=unclassified Streptomyces TaxID=2593676 RepID=UPI0033A68BAE
MTSVIEAALHADGHSGLIDPGWIRDTVAVAGLMELSTSTRADIEARTRDLLQHLSDLLRTDLGADQDPDVMALVHASYARLDLTRRPGPQTPAYAAFTYLKETADLTLKVLEVHLAKHKHGPDPQ